MTPKAIETALETLPRDLHETYYRMLQRIPADLAKDAMRLLQFLVYTERPLTLLEAVEVIATQTDGEPRGFNPNRRLFREADVLRYCPSLVSVIEASSDRGKTKKELHLTHFSVKEYLLKQEQFDLTSSSIVIARTCLSYLTGIIQFSFDKIEQDFPMAKYTAKYWMVYAALVETSEDVVRTTVGFLKTESTLQRWWQLLEADWNPGGSGKPELPPPSGLHCACLFGLSAVATCLLNECPDINRERGNDGYILQAAIIRCNSQVVRLLLDKGANIDAQGGDFGNALQVASVQGNNEVVQLLLDKGADVNAQGGTFGNALQAASRNGHRDIVQLLLRNGADVNTKGGYYSTALQAASRNGHRDIVQLLLRNGAKDVGGG